MFFKRKTITEVATMAKQEAKREVRISQREIEREIRLLDIEEKKIMIQIKQRAKQAGVRGKDDPALKSMAKNLVQVRNQRGKLYQTKANLGAVGLQATSMLSQCTAVSAVRSVTSSLTKANATVDTSKVAKIMNDFSRQHEKIQLKQDVMDNSFSMAFDTESIEVEAEDVASQVLAELGLETDQKMVNMHAPTSIRTSTTVKNATVNEEFASSNFNARIRVF